MANAQERGNQDAKIWVGDLDPQVTDSILWELMIQAGPVVNVHIPKDKLSGMHSGYGFVEFHSEEDADYALLVMMNVKLFGKQIRANRVSVKGAVDVGANIFIGNISPDIDEKILYDTFRTFGPIVGHPKIMRDDSGISKGYAFLSFDNFESSDAAIGAMSGQFLGGMPISVTYALKKGSKTERHGTPAERLLAANNPQRSRYSAPSFAPPVAYGNPMMPAYPGVPPTGMPAYPYQGY